jgi:hypothetical protein
MFSVWLGEKQAGHGEHLAVLTSLLQLLPEKEALQGNTLKKGSAELLHVRTWW